MLRFYLRIVSSVTDNTADQISLMHLHVSALIPDQFLVFSTLVPPQMAKNKGLTPKRKKIDRNPRVKHREKFRRAKIRRRGQVCVTCSVEGIMSDYHPYCILNLLLFSPGAKCP